MVKKLGLKKKAKTTLKKEVHLPIKLPDNKFGDFLSKKRKLPLATYFQESFRELKKVNWPTRKESLKLTLAVVVFTAIFTLFTALADLGISAVVERILL